MAQATIENRSAGRSPIEVAIDRVWRFFCSVRAAVAEIVFLAILVHCFPPMCSDVAVLCRLACSLDVLYYGTA